MNKGTCYLNNPKQTEMIFSFQIFPFPMPFFVPHLCKFFPTILFPSFLLSIQTESCQSKQQKEKDQKGKKGKIKWKNGKARLEKVKNEK